MLLLLLVLVTPASSFAQSDGFHIDPVDTCEASDSCLIATDGQVIKWIEYTDAQGHRVAKPSTNSSLSDVIYKGSQKRCFVGGADQACLIFAGLALSEDIYYGQGGHTRITKFSCEADAHGAVQLSFTVKSDMGSPEKVAQSFEACP